MQFLLCVTPKSQVCITFPQITQKILTKDIFHCLVLITEILSFLGIYNVRKRTRTLFLTSQKIMKRINKKIYSWHKSFKSKLQIIHVTSYIALFLPDFNKHFLYGQCHVFISVSSPFSFCVFLIFFFLFFTPRDIFCIVSFHLITICK